MNCSAVPSPPIISTIVLMNGDSIPSFTLTDICERAATVTVETTGSTPEPNRVTVALKSESDGFEMMIAPEIVPSLPGTPGQNQLVEILDSEELIGMAETGDAEAIEVESVSDLDLSAYTITATSSNATRNVKSWRMLR